MPTAHPNALMFLALANNMDDVSSKFNSNHKKWMNQMTEYIYIYIYDEKVHKQYIQSVLVQQAPPMTGSSPHSSELH
jgi:hypothetical protein